MTGNGALAFAIAGGIIAYLCLDPKPSTWSIGALIRHNRDGSWTVVAGKPKRKRKRS